MLPPHEEIFRRKRGVKSDLMVSQRVYYYCMVLVGTNKQATILIQLYTAAGRHVAITNFFKTLLAHLIA